MVPARVRRNRQLKGTVLVTGASSGIGRACAEHLAARGYTVFGGSRSAPNPTLAGATWLPMDVDSDASVADVVQRIVAATGRLDVVVNNAGIGLVGAVEETTVAEAKKVMETNLFGAWRVSRAALPHMRAQEAGTIVNVGSLGGLLGIPFQGAYSASKFALEGMSEALSAEVGRFGIRVVIVEPGDLPTALAEHRNATDGTVPESVYADELRAALSIMEEAERRGPAPALVARLVQRIIESRRPRLRYVLASPTQRIAALVKRVLPGRLFERILKRSYEMEDKRSG